MARDLIKIGTRGSPLALKQSTWVKKALSGRYPSLHLELVPIKTKGDKILDVPLAAVGGKGLFVKEIEEALLSGEVDLAVHSMKDMPGELPPGLVIGAVPLREDPRDVWISRDQVSFQAIPPQKKIGTSSLRRKSQLLHLRPDLQVVPLRGNLDSRIRKIESEDLEGIILAAAGLNRMGLSGLVTQILDIGLCLPAVGQGALVLEIREEDDALKEMVSCLNHQETALCTQAERSFLKRLQGGCQVPLAGHARFREGRLSLAGLIASLDGSVVIKEKMEGPAGDPEGLGLRLAEHLLDRGGREILDQVYRQEEKTEIKQTRL